MEEGKGWDERNQSQERMEGVSWQGIKSKRRRRRRRSTAGGAELVMK